MSTGRATASSYPAARFAQVLGQVVMRHRKQNQRNQGEVAGDLALSQGAYSRLESGGSVFNVAQLRMVAKSLGVTATGLLQGAEAAADRLAANGVAVLDAPKVAGPYLWLARESIAAVVAEAPMAPAAKPKQYVQTKVKAKPAHVTVGVRNG